MQASLPSLSGNEHLARSARIEHSFRLFAPMVGRRQWLVLLEPQCHDAPEPTSPPPPRALTPRPFERRPALAKVFLPPSVSPNSLIMGTSSSHLRSSTLARSTPLTASLSPLLSSRHPATSTDSQTEHYRFIV